MSKSREIIHYRAAMFVFNKWFDQGIINQEELLKIDAIIAGKYGLPLGSIYR